MLHKALTCHLRRTHDFVFTNHSHSCCSNFHYSTARKFPFPPSCISNSVLNHYVDKSSSRNATFVPLRNIQTSVIALQGKQEHQRHGSASTQKSLAESKGSGSQVSISLGEKVKENVKTSAYGGIILIGLAVTGGMIYVILSELFSSESPNNIYTKSFKICKADPRVQDLLGTPIKCYGEETRRGWRRHVAHQQFIHGTTKIIRMKFYVEGKHRKGTVHLEKKTNDKGKYEYTYLLVDVDGYPPQRIEVDASNF